MGAKLINRERGEFIHISVGLSQQTTVLLNYSQSIKINVGPSDGGTIISSSHISKNYSRILSTFFDQNRY